MVRLARPAIVIAVIAAVVRVEPLVGVAAGVGAWLLVSWWLPRHAIAGVEIERHHPDRIMWGDEAEVRFTATIPQGMRWLSITDVTPFDLGSSARYVVSPFSGEVLQRSRPINARRRGLHTIGPTLIQSGDLFGIGSTSRQVGGTGRILVYPQIVPAGDLPVTPESPQPVLPNQRPLFFDPHRIRGVRDYQVGDAMRSIHWTASASIGSLVVKELEPAISQDVVIAVDMSQASHPRSGRHRSGELSVIAAASLMHHYVTVDRRPVGLRLAGLDAVTSDPMDIDRSPESDHRHLMDGLELLSRVRLHRDRASHALLDPFGLGFGSTVIHVTGRLANEQAADLVALRRRGASVHVVVTGEPPEPEVQAVLASEQIGLGVIDRSSDLAVDL